MSGWTHKVAGWIEAEGLDFWAATVERLEHEMLLDGGDCDLLCQLARAMEDHVVVYRRVPRFRLSTVDFLAIAREYLPVYA